MTGVFSGALAYEFTQEPNDYGLVSINGTTAYILNDYNALRSQYELVTSVTAGTTDTVTRPKTCPPADSYANLNGTNDLPATPDPNLIAKGIASNLYSAGKLVTPSTWSTNYTIVDSKGNVITTKSISQDGSTSSNGPGSTDNSTTGGKKSGVGRVRGSAVLAVLAIGGVAWNNLA
jgi:1,3-beta-glucanosyltransferase GAS3